MLRPVDFSSFSGAAFFHPRASRFRTGQDIMSAGVVSAGWVCTNQELVSPRLCSGSCNWQVLYKTSVPTGAISSFSVMIGFDYSLI